MYVQEQSVVSYNASEFQHTQSLHFSITTCDQAGNIEINGVFMLSEKGHAMEQPENTLPCSLTTEIIGNTKGYKRIYFRCC
jgi:hypothetical protein